MREPTFEPPSLDRKEGDFITQVREYKLITPLFGGGVTPGEADPVTIIRGTEIRGQLRFWWRATQGGRFNGDLKAMKAAEDELWGAASAGKDKKSKPSLVQIYLNILNKGKKFVVPDQRQGKRGQEVHIANYPSPYSYVAFPLEEDRYVREGVEFQLNISFPANFRRDMEAALWAWEIFGGIGARTRRGFGALYCTCIKEDNVEKQVNRPPRCHPAEVQRWLKVQLQQHVTDGAWPDELPHLPRNTASLRIVSAQGGALGAWRRLINALYNFRQSREGSKFGSTHWPEANAVRDLTDNPISEKSPFIGQKYPRAYFGLPIIFHFPHDKGLDEATLRGLKEGTKIERFASPLILRPLACNETDACGLAIVLEGPELPPGNLILDGNDDNLPKPVEPTLSPSEAENITPLRNRTHKTKILQAFLESLEENRR